VTHPITSPETPAPRDPADPGTQEMGVAPAGATATGTHQMPPVDSGLLPGEVQPTGPVGSLPGLPGTETPPPDAADHPLDLPLTAGKRPRPARTPRTPRTSRTPRTAHPPRTPRTPQERATLIGTGLTALSFVLLQLGLTLGFGEASLWSAVQLWSVFATLATLLGALPFAVRFLPTARLRPDTAWKIAAGGLTGLAVFWVLVVLPRVDSDRGFVLTAALAALGAALWVAPSRSRR
jgi:hypothetical protein